MAELFVFDRNDSERKTILEISRDVVAYCSDEQLIVIECKEQKNFHEYLTKAEQIDFSVMEITEKVDVRLAEKVRENHMDASLMIITDSSISPMEYLNPRIRANSLLLRPYSKETERQTICEFLRDFYRRKDVADTGKYLQVESRQGNKQIPFSQIYYIEVCEKKLYVRLKNHEYSQYGTLDKIQQLLPKNFLRCHRSYICNMNFVEKIRLSENTLYLECGVTVPLSRTYKSVIRDYFSEDV